MSENKALDVVEKEIETVPEAGGMVTGLTEDSIENQLWIAENIEKLVAAQNKIRMAVLKLAQPGDWVTFGSGDTSKAEIGFAGAMRIGSTLGVNFVNWFAEKEKGTDEIGEWFRWNYECDATFKGRIIRVYGRASSRDVFLGKSGGEYRAVHEVDEGNIKMIARRAAMKEGVKVIFGLHHMDPNVVNRAGISLASAGGHTFKSKDEKAEELSSVTVSIKEVTQKKGGTEQTPWTKFTIIDGQGIKYGTFSESFARVAKSACDSFLKVEISCTKSKYGYDITGIKETEKVEGGA